MRLAIAALLVAATAAHADRLRVHVDTIAPGKTDAFVAARATWVKWIGAHHAVDPWGGTILQVGASTFFTLKPFAKWAELDAPSTPPAVSLDPKVQAAYNHDSDAVLVAPHTTEVWVPEPDLDFDPGAHLPIEKYTYGVLVAETVQPNDDAYETAWKATKAKLAAAKYPVARFTFFSAYGTGKVMSLWLAPSKAAFLAAAPNAALATGTPVIVRADLSN